MLANDITTIPNVPMITEVIPTWFKIYLFNHKISNTPMIIRLKRLLPNAAPIAMSGAPTRATELTPVPISGREVAVARRTTPANDLPMPVFEAIISAVFVRKTEAIKISIAAMASWPHSNAKDVIIS